MTGSHFRIGENPDGRRLSRRVSQPYDPQGGDARISGKSDPPLSGAPIMTQRHRASGRFQTIQTIQTIQTVFSRRAPSAKSA